PRQPNADAHALRPKLRPRAETHAQHHAAGAECIVRDPVDEFAQFRPQWRIFELFLDVLEPVVEPRIADRILGPDYAERFTRAQRHADHVPGFKVETVRHAV